MQQGEDSIHSTDGDWGESGNLLNNNHLYILMNKYPVLEDTCNQKKKKAMADCCCYLWIYPF